MEIEELVHLYDTPIIIYHEIVYKDVDEVKRESDRIKAFVESWRRAWVGKDFPAYIAKYSKDFTSNDGKDYKAWADHKRRLTEQYNKIEVELGSLRVFRHQGMILVLFEQYYRGDGFKSDGLKQLYLREKDGDDYEIAAEVWHEFPPKTKPRMLSAEVKRQVVEEHREAMAKVGPEPKAASQPEPVMAAKAQPKAGPGPEPAPVQVAQAPVASPPRVEPVVDSEAELEKIFVAVEEPPVVQPPVRTAQADPTPAPGDDAGKNTKPQPQPVPASDQPAPAPKNEPLPKPAPPAPDMSEIESAESAAGSANPEMDAVKRTVDEWLAAWRSRDVNRYIRHYHTDFRYKNMDREKYRAFKTSLAEKYNEIVIGVQKLEIAVDGGEARVTFIQDYRSDSYSDYGLKTLVMQKQDGGWRIKRENWQDLSGAGAKP
jgi:ketosteroid isomerase-like protein